MESREEFVLSWLNDMLTDEELKRLEQGLELFKDSFKGSFSELSDSDQQKRLIEGLKAEDLSGEFLRQIKNISTLHFRTTENYMTQYLNYEFIPGRYLGCKNRVAI
jgi:hypothetical protein